MLTRNLYDLEEVKASLTYSLLIGKTRESIFWAQEILASECGWELGGVLIRFWIEYCCPNDFFIPVKIRRLDFDGDMDKDIIAIIMRLCACKKQNRVMEIIVKGFASMPWPCYRVNPNKEQLLEAEERSKVCGLEPIQCFKISQALATRRAGRAWHIADRCLVDGVRKLLRLITCAREKVVIDCLVDLSETEGFRRISLAACCIILADVDSFRTDVEYSDIAGLMMSADSWIKKQGQRQGRIYDIEKRALYGLKKKADIRELYDIYPRLAAATPFWQRIVAGYDMTSDEAKEKFYETWFPNDIPDEWSLEDQQKSHRATSDALETDPRVFAAIYYWDMRKSNRYAYIMGGKDFRNMDAV
jgi:hypothetical protein